MSGSFNTPSIEETILYRDLLEFLSNARGGVSLIGEGALLNTFLEAVELKNEISTIHSSDDERLRRHGIALRSLQEEPPADTVIVCADRDEETWYARIRESYPQHRCYRAVFDSVLLEAHQRGLPIRRNRVPKKMYLICSSQRTGSTLLVHLLRKTGVLGYPSERFREFLTQRIEAGTLSYDSIVPHVFSTFQTSNGVFGVKVHGHQYSHFQRAVAGLESDFGAEIKQSLEGAVYISLSRRDVVAQAVSLWRAKETLLYHDFISPMKLLKQLPRYLTRAPSEKRAVPVYDYQLLKAALLEILQERRVWEQVFSEQRIKPLILYYEDFTTELSGTLKTLAEEMGVSIPLRKRVSAAPCRKLADSDSVAIGKRFVNDLAQADRDLHRQVQREMETT